MHSDKKIKIKIKTFFKNGIKYQNPWFFKTISKKSPFFKNRSWITLKASCKTSLKQPRTYETIQSWLPAKCSGGWNQLNFLWERVLQCRCCTEKGLAYPPIRILTTGLALRISYSRQSHKEGNSLPDYKRERKQTHQESLLLGSQFTGGREGKLFCSMGSHQAQFSGGLYFYAAATTYPCLMGTLWCASLRKHIQVSKEADVVWKLLARILCIPL